MIFEWAQDSYDALAAMPTEHPKHPKHRMLELLEEAIRHDIHFVDRQWTTLLQCMWDTYWPRAGVRGCRLHAGGSLSMLLCPA